MNNIYPVWWDTSVTIYNKYEDKQTSVVTWYKTVVTGAFWKYIGNKIDINDVTLQSNNITCRIRKSDDFLEKYVWIDLTSEQKAKYFTLGPEDIIVKGEVADTIDEYTAGHRSTDLIQKYKALQGCMEVQRVAIDVGPGRCCEHYYVIGE